MPQHELSCPDHAENSHASHFLVRRKGGHGLTIHSLHKMPNLLAVSTLLTYTDITPVQSKRQARGSPANGGGKYYWRYSETRVSPFVFSFLWMMWYQPHSKN